MGSDTGQNDEESELVQDGDPAIGDAFAIATIVNDRGPAVNSDSNADGGYEIK